MSTLTAAEASDLFRRPPDRFLDVGAGALGQRGWHAGVIRVAGDEFAQRADGSLVVAGFREAPAALIEQAGAVFLAHHIGIDLAVNLGGGSQVAVGEKRLRLHHQRGVDARVFRAEFAVKLEEGIHLIRDVTTLDLIETEQPVIGSLEGEVRLRLDEALDFAEEPERLLRFLEAHVGTGSQHQAGGFFFAGGLGAGGTEDIDHLLVFLFGEIIAHLRRLRIGAEVLHAGGAYHQREVAVGHIGAAEPGGGQRGLQCGLTADFGRVGCGDHFLEALERLLGATCLEIEMAEGHLGLRCEQPAGGVLDDFVEAFGSLVVTAHHAVAISREIVAAGAFLRLGGACGIALEHRCGEDILALVVMVRGQRVSGGGGPFPLSVAVDERAEAALGFLDLAGLVMAVAEIPPGHLRIGVARELGKILGEKLCGALEVFGAVGEIGGTLRGVVEVFAAQEEIIAGIRCEGGIHHFGAWRLGGSRAGKKQGDGERAFQVGGRDGWVRRGHSAASGRWVANEMFQMPAFWQVSITSTMRW